MIFIIEGPDGSGKTTLANKLSKLYDYKIAHFKAPTSVKEEANMLKVYKWLLEEEENIIVDRAWPSEMVYGPIFREHTFITDAAVDMLEKTFGYKLMYIYCTGKPEAMWERAQQRGEEYVTDFEVFKQVCKSYDEIMDQNKHIVPVVKYEI